MDYKAIAEAALKRAEDIAGEIRTVRADESLEAEARDAKIAALRGDMEGAEAEARQAVEDAEREAEIRSLGGRAAALIGASKGKEKRTEGQDVNADLRALFRGEVREVSVKGEAGEYRAAKTDTHGEAVPRSFVAEVIESLRESDPIFAMSRIINTNGGEPLDWPKKASHTTNVGTVAEGAAYLKGETTLDTFTLGATKYGVIVQVSQELLEDSAFDIASFVAQDAGTEVGRKVAADAVAALLTDAGAGATVAGAIDGDDLLDMYHSVVSGYRRNAQWLMNDATALVVRKFKDANDQYLWQPGLVAGQPDALLARPVHTSVSMPVAASGQAREVALFGDFSKFIIRQVNDLKITRSDEYGYDSDLVSFKVSWRGDFGLSDTAAIKSLTQTAA